MNIGSSALKKLLAEKVFVVGIVILFIVSGVITVLGEKLGGVGWMEEREVDDGLGCVTDIGRVGDETSHGKWTGGRGGGYKGGDENDSHMEQDEFGGSWFDGFDDDSGIESGLGRLEADEHTVGLWHFDEGSGNEAKDASGNGNDGTLQNMEEGDWVDGKYRIGLEFDGRYLFS